MKTPHKHAKVIKAWADGAQIQHFEPSIKQWFDIKEPCWNVAAEYRVKPLTKKYRLYLYVNRNTGEEVIRVANVDSVSITVMAGFVKWLGDWQEIEI